MSRNGRLGRILVIVLVTVGVLTAGSVLMTQRSTPRQEDAITSFPDPGLVHVHGLGVDPADGALYAASHMGLFRLPEEQAGEAIRVADRWQDTMAFTVVGSNRFLASGHPDMREDKPVLLGLIESRDAGQTWQALSLEGRSDFHFLQPAGKVLYGYDSAAEQLLITRDWKRWEPRAALALTALAVDPADAEVVLGATTDGQLQRSEDGGRSFSPIPRTPRLTALAWSPSSPLYGSTRDGTLITSRDGGLNWRSAGKLDGPADALTPANGNTLHAATATGIYSSTDGGATFTLRYRLSTN